MQGSPRARRDRSPYGSFLLGPAEQDRRVLRIRVQLLLTVLLVTTNVIGALVTVSLLLLVMPRGPVADELVLAAAVGIPVYVAVAVLVGAVLGTAATLRALRWAEQQREPTAVERRTTLLVPLRLTGVQALLWAGATALFTVVAAVLQPDLALSVGLTNGIAGVVVCAVSYQLAEFALRPIAARALADAPDPEAVVGLPGSGVRRRLLTFWLLGTGVPITGLLVTGILVLAGDPMPKGRLALIAIVLCAVVLVFGLLVTTLDARAVTSPLLSVRDAMQRVEGGDLDVALPVYDGSELGALQAGFNRMASGLRERERIHDLFGRHVGRDVAAAALAREVELGGEVRRVSVLFTDLVGSTEYAASHPPAEVVALLNRFCAVVVDEVDRHGGLVNKFMGDAVLAVFGAPVAADDHADRALAAARAIHRRLAAEVAEVGAGTGVTTGDAVAGNVGDERRFEYTVIGDAVNEAARLTELAKERGGLLGSGTALEAASEGERVHWSTADEVVLRGRALPTVLALPAGHPDGDAAAQASDTRSA